MYNLKVTSKKAQLGETMTWVVATLTIIVILAISIYVVSFNIGERRFNVREESNLYAVKSVSSYMLTEGVYEKLSEGAFTEKTGNFAVELFEGFYGDYYKVWLGFYINRTFIPYPKNDYFEDKPLRDVRGDVSFDSTLPTYILEEFYLKGEKSFNLVLKGKTK